MLDSNNQSEEIKSKDEKLYPSEQDYENFSYYTHPELVAKMNECEENKKYLQKENNEQRQKIAKQNELITKMEGLELANKLKKSLK